MSFFSRLFPKRPACVHPVFGEMSFVKIAPGKSYWEGRAFFAPAGTTIEVMVDGDQSGVAAGAEAFFEEVQKRYAAIVAKHRAEMDDKMSALSRVKIPDDFAAAYRLASLSIPDTRHGTEWTLGFDFQADQTFFVSLEFEDWDHAMVVIDS